MNLSSHVPTSSSTAKSPIASKSPGILTAAGKPENRTRRNSKSDAASSSQVRLTPRLPRVVLRANSQRGQQVLRSQDARSSWDPPSESKSYGETWNNAVDCRIPGIPLSTFEQKDTTRENKVKKFIEKFENHQHKESLYQDLSQTQKINKFSEQSKDLIADTDNTEIFELCENSSKHQCPECNTYWETGTIYRSCGRNYEIFAETNRVRAKQP